ncbi:MAG: Acetoin utilization protein AcuC [Candidatus Dependentiae bacterium ADurb.Bin331]|nr:MAG: Acetoin utilization protein AcuC [Candidatus Dependentiae bacterium ADurb.Bin331]
MKQKNILLSLCLFFSLTSYHQPVHSVDWQLVNPTQWSTKTIIAATVGTYLVGKTAYNATYKWLQKPVADAQKLPVFYHDNYNIRMFGIEKLPIHPFDSTKYEGAHALIKNQLNLSDNHFRAPASEVSKQDLLKVHTEKYLTGLNSRVVAGITGIPLLSLLPNFLIQRNILSPMRLATQGTIDAAEYALNNKTAAINLGGGYHHAKRTYGEGFCVYSDMPLAITKLREKIPTLKVLYIDLDAHRGNGFASYYVGDNNIFILDCYNENNYPFKIKPDENAIDNSLTSYHIYCSDKCRTNAANRYIKREKCDQCRSKYLTSLETALDKLPGREKFNRQPDLIVYNAGTDPYEGDALGRMNLTKAGIIQRDEMVFRFAQKQNIPLVMTTSGGYSKESAQIIGESIVNLYNNHLIRNLENKHSK